MALHGTLATVSAQAPQTRGFSVAFAYLAELHRTGSESARRLDGLAVGESRRVELADGVFAIEQVYETRSRADGFFESHRIYIDVQAIVAGEELMEVADLDRMSVREPYQSERDLIIYHDFSGASVLWLRSGDAAVFYPSDVHMPSLRVGVNAGLVRKSVVKIPVH